MSRPLLIVWKDEFNQGEPIIDEQHHGVVATINSLHYFLHQGLALNQLRPTISVLKNYLMFHFKTEEGILMAMEYPNLEQYQTKMNRLIKEFDLLCEQAINNEQAKDIQLFLKNWWVEHMHHHEDISPYLHRWSGEYCRI
jgi:hemerythrin